jgi:glycosyltransferase involved in cell wall biosynthesis
MIIDAPGSCLSDAVRSAANARDRKRFLLIQYGDYREGYYALASGGPTTYYAHRYSIDSIAELGKTAEEVGVICCSGNTRYDEVLPNHVRVMDAGVPPWMDPRPLLRQVERFGPTHLILATPLMEVLEWALPRGVDILPRFADSFTLPTHGVSPARRVVRAVRHHFHHRKLARLLNDRRIRWVSNHNVPACEDLVRIGVNPQKVVPWDWPCAIRPDAFEVKSGPAPGAPWQLLFVGCVFETKGVGDVIDAVVELQGRGRDVQLRVVGPGEIDRFSRHAAERGVAHRVAFEGQQPHDRVLQWMAATDLVVVPSRHSYPEGLPMVIYEAFCTRTPLICSDHPMFRKRVASTASRSVPECRPDAMATAVEQTLSDRELYRRMSQATQTAWERLQESVRLDDLIRHWLGRTPEDDRWLAEHNLASGRYHH